MKALEQVGNPNLLINLISRRVRQLNSGGGGLSRPFVENTETLGAADVALREVVEGKITYQLLSKDDKPQPAPKRKKRRAAATAAS